MVPTTYAIFAVAACFLVAPSLQFDCLGEFKTVELNSISRMAYMQGDAETLKANYARSLENDEPNLSELIKFYLYTTETINDKFQLFVDDVATLQKSKFDSGNPTKIIIHGYINSVESEVIQGIKNSFLNVGNFNVIGVDWGLIANTILYHVAAEQTDMVGHYVARFVDFLVEQNIPRSDIHLIGHSLGAHVAGFAGANITTGKVSRISGLDPAKPCFYNSPIDLRLDGTDAEFVDCIHTCGGYLGLMEQICQADFYANGGKDTQPGCLLASLGICSHQRSHEYYAESIIPYHSFASLKCDQIPYNLDSCKQSPNLMGYGASPEYTGIFYSATRASYPYSYNVTA